MLNLAHIKLLLNAQDFSPADLISALEQSPELMRDFEADDGVWEGYSVKEHSIMVLTQFEKYFRDKIPASTTLAFWRIMLAVHDTGKFEAISQGDKKRQHEFTLPIVEKVFTDLEFSSPEISLAREIVGQMGIGEFIRGRLGAEETKRSLQASAAKQNIPYPTFLEVMTIYWMCDAGSYTQDAGGKRSLDYEFEFDPENRICKLKPEYQVKYALLK